MNSIIHTELSDLYKQQSGSDELLIVPFYGLGVKPNQLQVRENVSVYDVDAKLESQGIIEKVDYPTKTVEILILKDSIKPVAIRNVRSTTLQSKVTGPFDPYALIGAILSAAFIYLFITQTAIYNSFILNTFFGTFERQEILDAGNIDLWTRYSWFVIFVPILAIILTRIHWRMRGDRITGVIGAILSGTAFALSFKFALLFAAYQNWLSASLVQSLVYGYTGIGITFIMAFSIALLLTRGVPK